MKEISNTKLLVSIQHCWNTSANLEIFDVSQKGQPKRIYSFEEVSGSQCFIKIIFLFITPIYQFPIETGNGDVTYNSRRNILAAIPVTGKITYHLFSVDPNASNSKDIIKLNQKSKWRAQIRTQEGNQSFLFITLHCQQINPCLDNFIRAFDFNPTGESIATIDNYGGCLISDVNTSNYGFHMKIGQYGNSNF